MSENTQAQNIQAPSKKTVTVPVGTAKVIIETMADETMSKSQKIRTIYGLGISQYKTAQLVGVIPQFVNNVVTRDKNKKPATK